MKEEGRAAKKLRRTMLEFNTNLDEYVVITQDDLKELIDVALMARDRKWFEQLCAMQRRMKRLKLMHIVRR